MKLKRVTTVLLAGVMAMGLVACGSGSDTAADTTTSTSTATDTADDSESSDLLGSADATIHLKVGTTTAPDGHYVLGLVEMQKKLEEYSNGEMTLDIYPNSALGGESDMMDAVSMGTQDMVLSSTGPIPDFSSATDNWATLDCRICLRLQRMHTKYLTVRSDRAFWTSLRDLVSKQSDSGRMDSVS